MKQIIKIIAANIFSCLLVLVLFDYFLFFNFSNLYKTDIGNYGIFASNNDDRIESDLPYDRSKGSIVTIGCSFIYGDGILEDETLAYKLQKLTMRKTFNHGHPGTGIQHVLLQLQNLDFINDDFFSPPPNILYTFL